MSTKIPESHVDLFHKKAFGSFTTLMSDGSPQTTPVWVDFVDGKVLVNSALGRQKDKKSGAILASLLRSSIPTIRTDISKSAAVSARSHTREPISSSTSYPKSIWIKTSIPSPSRVRSA